MNLKLVLVSVFVGITLVPATAAAGGLRILLTSEVPGRPYADKVRIEERAAAVYRGVSDLHELCRVSPLQEFMDLAGLEVPIVAPFMQFFRMREFIRQNVEEFRIELENVKRRRPGLATEGENLHRQIKQLEREAMEILPDPENPDAVKLALAKIDPLRDQIREVAQKWKKQVAPDDLDMRPGHVEATFRSSVRLARDIYPLLKEICNDNLTRAEQVTRESLEKVRRAKENAVRDRRPEAELEKFKADEAHWGRLAALIGPAKVDLRDRLAKIEKEIEIKTEKP